MNILRLTTLARLVPGLALLVMACAGGPPPDYPPKTPSTAFEDYATTRLGQNLGRPNDAHPDLSGFRLMPDAREAFILRLALADAAECSLDMQYYIWDPDTTGRIIIDRVMRAADRGVRVRLLVDDPFYHDLDQAIAELDAHPNVEIRFFNPVTNRQWWQLDLLANYDRLNRRMHNKLMVADNAAAIVGGRNIGDIYYGVNTYANYRDLDVAVVGPVVRDLSAVFDAFWNAPTSVPISDIVDHTYGQADLDARVAKIRADIAAADYPYPIDQDLETVARQSAAFRDSMVWADGRIIFDDPHAIATGEDADDVSDFLLSRIDRVQDELLIQSPYFVLRSRGIAKAGELHDRGVRVRVLTNSLSSNDVLPVHAGYSKTRKRLLENGMEIHELRADTEAFRPNWSFKAGGSRAALHAKALVFDREAVFIGSFNLDPRSGEINTEAGLYIESPELAEQLAGLIQDSMAPENSYRLLLDNDGGLVWETRENGETVRYDDEPKTSFGRRFTTDLLKMLPLDSQL
jgi:putative cardiolipin synthase